VWDAGLESDKLYRLPGPLEENVIGNLRQCRTLLRPISLEKAKFVVPLTELIYLRYFTPRI